MLAEASQLILLTSDKKTLSQELRTTIPRYFVLWTSWALAFAGRVKLLLRNNDD